MPSARCSAKNGPRTDVADTTTYAYYTDTVFNAAGEGHTIGDLRSITNAAAHVTKYTLYDRAGRLLRRLEANGAETRYAYSPRGWLRPRCCATRAAGTLHQLYL